MANNQGNFSKPDEYEELLVVAMTRPAMVWGMPLTGVVMGFYFPLMVLLITKELILLALLPPTLIFVYMVSLQDIYLFNIGFFYMPLWASGRRGYKSYEPK